MKFSGKVSRDMSHDHTKCHLSLKNVKDGEICPCAKFRFNYIFVARNIANKHFSLKKPLTRALNTLSGVVSDQQVLEVLEKGNVDQLKQEYSVCAHDIIATISA